MKSGAREDAERKKKASKKFSPMATKKKSSLKKIVELEGEVRPNKHRSYLKIVKDEETGDYHFDTVSGKDLFYMGTYDSDLSDYAMDQIIEVCFQGRKDSKLVTRKVNATLASILEIDPQDSIELMLATQMTAVHHMAMQMSARAMLSEQTDYGVSENINRMIKLMRTYTSQIEALNKYRNKGKQQITVKHQHVNVTDGGQAVIGDVNQGGGDG